ncbi:molybdenum cofactor biosynthesis protein B [Pelagibaculum spongiae]|uniref:Molybdenum cofactor biosynthesis protein B n=1 Tax=Pelagibaculum spongiae TaxID=2080658 RepID=A0A2V1H2M4_9GAMM|nr:molybdenum cofactor biosynthesis protein B [Pelagibaculum spongiae]PVZ70651.1 molybdenum cofactor biosynthesis protein B [Pelagibaculum spongiae]
MAHVRFDDLVPLHIAVLTVSDTRTLENDTSGQYLVDQLQEAGHKLVDRAIIQDDVYQLRAKVSAWIADENVQVVLMTGGTGFTARDNTPQAMRPLFDSEIQGFGELFRQLSYDDIGSSTIQSRSVAGFANGSVIFCMPGSTGACRLGWTKILKEQLDSRHKPCNFVPQLKLFDNQEAMKCQSRG